MHSQDFRYYSTSDLILAPACVNQFPMPRCVGLALPPNRMLIESVLDMQTLNEPSLVHVFISVLGMDNNSNTKLEISLV